MSAVTPTKANAGAPEPDGTAPATASATFDSLNPANGDVVGT